MKIKNQDELERERELELNRKKLTTITMGIDEVKGTTFTATHTR